jgi:hypothetical protein
MGSSSSSLFVLVGLFFLCVFIGTGAVEIPYTSIEIQACHARTEEKQAVPG